MSAADRKGFQVAVLYNASDHLIKGERQDILSEQGVIICAKTIIEALRSEGFKVADVPITEDVETALEPYPPDKWVVFNLGEGLAGRFFEEARIAWALEAMGYAFTGSGGEAIARSTHKAMAKSLLNRSGLSTPEWWLFERPDQVTDSGESEISFPLIVKPIAEDGSIGLNESAVVHTLASLRERVAYVAEVYRQAALVESFVAGREFNVALLGDPPEVLPLAEIDFRDFSDPYARIVSFEAKWDDRSFEYHHTPAICPADLPSNLAHKIQSAALRAWHVIGCRGYARVDIRLSASNIPYIIEVNCNPDISANVGFHNAARAAGYTYKEMLMRILKNARRPLDVYGHSSHRIRWFQNFGHIRKNKSVQ